MNFALPHPPRGFRSSVAPALALLLILAWSAIARATTYTVNTLDDHFDSSCDSSDCTLREAVNAANSGDTVNFDASLSGAIVLAGGTITPAHDITIDGPTSNLILIDAAFNGAAFQCNNSVTLTLNRLNIVDGSSSGILNYGILTLNGCAVVQSTNFQNGGGIYSEGQLVLENCTIANNTTTGGGIGGGGVCSLGSAIVANCTITGNSSSRGGGIAGNVELVNTIVTGNSAPTYADIVANLTSLGSNVIGDPSGASGWAGSDLLYVDPAWLFGGQSFGLNGGPTFTIPLLAGSPALDMGADTTASPFFISTDQRGAGYLRKAGPAVDAGAYEYQPAVTGYNQSISVAQGVPRTVVLQGTGISTLTYKITSLPANGDLYAGQGTGGHHITAAEAAAGYALPGQIVTYVSSITTYSASTSFQYKVTDYAATSAASTISISIAQDNTAPTACSVSAPTGIVNGLPAINGTASDNTGGSGIKRVRVYLRRAVSGGYQFWGLNTTTNQYDWGTNQRFLTATLAAPGAITTAWGVTANLPTGANLANGTYYVHAIAEDYILHTKQSATDTFVLDSGNPTSLTITTAGPLHNFAGGLAGTANDNSDGTGIAQVGILLARFDDSSDNFYWDGSQWQPSATYLTATLGTPNGISTTWSIAAANLPSGGNQVEGRYQVQAVAYDRAGNSLGVTKTIAIDNMAPTWVGITAPLNAVPNLGGGITGAAADFDNGMGGSGIVRVRVDLRRYVSGAFQYWGLNTSTNAYDWSSTSRFFNATLATPGATGTLWSVTANLPGGANLADGTYYIHAIATDGIGYTLQSATDTFVVDSTKPAAVVVNTPASSAILKDFAAGIAGNASDNTGGSGINHVQVFLRRPLTAGGFEYWDFSAHQWNTTQHYATATLGTPGGATTTWTVSGNLPGGTTDLVSGTYYIHADAYDGAGNMLRSSTRSFTADATPPVAAAANVGSFGNPSAGFTGTAQDDTNGSGINTVSVALTQQVGATTNYWGLNPTTHAYEWSTTARQLAATVSPVNGRSVTWSLSSNLPTPAQVPGGSYGVQVTARDRAGNIFTGANQTFSVDGTAPNYVSITSQSYGQHVPGNAYINGQVGDDASGSGIAEVRLYLRRPVSGGYQYFGLNTSTNTYQWSNSPLYLLTELEEPAYTIENYWLRPLPYPNGQPLPNGIYYLHAVGVDGAGNTVQSAPVQIVVDSTPPTATVTTPAAGSFLTDLGAGIAGTVQDDPTGFGVANAYVLLQRTENGNLFYWSRTYPSGVYVWSQYPSSSLPPGFGIPAALATPNAASSTWTITSPLPSGTDLPDTTYTIQVKVTDVMNNVATTPAQTFVVDTTAPAAVAVTTPASGSTLSSLSAGLAGTASDNTGGSGIARVRVYLRRPVTGGYQYWGLNTTTSQYEWSSTARYFTSTLSAPNAISTNWSVTANLPSGANLPNGTYYVHASANDRAGNVLTSAVRSFTVSGSAGAPGGSAASGASLSTATARASSQSVALTFNRSLDGTSGADPSHYAVSIAGRAVAIESAGYNPATRTVTLALPEASFSAGDALTVRWDGVLDGQGATASGSVTVTAR